MARRVVAGFLRADYNAIVYGCGELISLQISMSDLGGWAPQIAPMLLRVVDWLSPWLLCHMVVAMRRRFRMGVPIETERLHVGPLSVTVV